MGRTSQPIHTVFLRQASLRSDTQLSNAHVESVWHDHWSYKYTNPHCLPQKGVVTFRRIGKQGSSEKCRPEQDAQVTPEFSLIQTGQFTFGWVDNQRWKAWVGYTGHTGQPIHQRPGGKSRARQNRTRCHAIQTKDKY